MAGKKLCFVLMPFGPNFDLVWHYGIKRALAQGALKAEWMCRRADDTKAPGIVMDSILADIGKANVLVADLSTSNPNVLYELGYAHAAGKPTVLIAQEELRDLPFDVSGHRAQRYAATYKGLEDLRSWIRGAVRGEWESSSISPAPAGGPPAGTSPAPSFRLRPSGPATAAGVPFILCNEGEGVAFETHLRWGNRLVVYGKPLEPGYESQVFIEGLPEIRQYAGTPLPEPVRVDYLDPQGHKQERRWEITLTPSAGDKYEVHVSKLRVPH